MNKWMITIYQPYDVGFELFDSKEEAEEEYERKVNEYKNDYPLLSDLEIILSEVECSELIKKNESLHDWVEKRKEKIDK